MSERGSLLFKNSIAQVEAVFSKVMLTITILVGLKNPGEGVAVDKAAVTFTAISLVLNALLAVVLVFRLNITDNPDVEPAKPSLWKLHIFTVFLFSLAVVSDVVIAGLGIKGFS